MLSCGRQSFYIWTDRQGATYKILQKQGRRARGCPHASLISLLTSNSALRMARSQLQEDEFLIVYLDDLYIVTDPSRARIADDIVTQAA